MPDTDQQEYSYSNNGRVLLDGKSGSYSPEEVDQYIDIARNDPGWDPEHTADWEGPQQTVLFKSESRRVHPRPDSVGR